MKIKLLTAIFLCLIATTSVHATIIDNDTYTTDNTLGLNFLDIDETGLDTYSGFNTGINKFGKSWRLATVNEIDSFFSNIIGYTISHPTAPSGVNFTNRGDAQAILDLVYFSGASTTWGTGLGQGFGFLKDTQTLSANSIGLHTQFNDTHMTNQPKNDTSFAWLVSDTTPTVPTIPEPSAIALMGLGLLGFGVTRRKQKKS